MQEVKQEIKEEKAMQRIEWMKWEARKPDLKLIRKARAEEEKRKTVVGESLPEFFRQLQKEEPMKELIVELEKTEPKTIDVQEPEHEQAEVVPIKRQIGFHMEPKSQPNSVPLFQPNLEAREKAVQAAKALKEELGRIPKKRELIKKGLSDHYARLALNQLKKD